MRASLFASAMLWLDPTRPRHKQTAQIAIATFRDLTGDCVISRGDLPRHKPELGGEVASLGECLTGADRSDRCTRDERADARYAHQSFTATIAAGQSSQSLADRNTVLQHERTDLIDGAMSGPRRLT
jgi:hypothetical protein